MTIQHKETELLSHYTFQYAGYDVVVLVSKIPTNTGTVLGDIIPVTCLIDTPQGTYQMEHRISDELLPNVELGIAMGMFADKTIRSYKNCIIKDKI